MYALPKQKLEMQEKKREQVKQRGSVPHLPIRDYCPHPSNHWKRRFSPSRFGL
jgi:hypothetical protein